jgi:hypothetical protein
MYGFRLEISTLLQEAVMNIAQICFKLRGQMVLFSGKLSEGLPKVMRRFVAEAIYGIAARGSVRLSETVRALAEEISLKKTIDRLSARVAYAGLARHLTEAVIRDASSRIKHDMLLIVDISEVARKYARNMQYLSRIRDGSEGKIADGYWTCDIVGVEVGEGEIVPLYHELYSAHAPDFKCENDEILKALEVLSTHIEDRGIYVIDRGGDRGILIRTLLDGEKRFLIRLKGDRHLIYKGTVIETKLLAEGIPNRTPRWCSKRKRGRRRYIRVAYGVRKVKLPGRRERLFLLVVKGLGAEPLMLLTNVELRNKRQVLWRMVEAYVTRWKVEETIRFIKQSYELEDIRVLTHERLRNIAALVLVVAYFTAVHVGLRARLEIMVIYVLRAAKRIFGIPNFRYYALADGIKEILGRMGTGLWVGNAKESSASQLGLFCKMGKVFYIDLVRCGMPKLLRALPYRRLPPSSH